MRRDIFQASADPTRSTILGLLALRVMTPNALTEQFAFSGQAISKPINILTGCRLVIQVPSGRENFYHFDSKI